MYLKARDYVGCMHVCSVEKYRSKNFQWFLYGYFDLINMTGDISRCRECFIINFSLAIFNKFCRNRFTLSLKILMGRQDWLSSGVRRQIRLASNYSVRRDGGCSFDTPVQASKEAVNRENFEKTWLMADKRRH